MSATDATRYRIVEHGNPGWIVVRRFNEHGCRMVEVHNPDLSHMTYDNGPAVVRCPESHLIPAAGTPRAVVDAPTEGATHATVGASSPPAAGIPVPVAGGTIAAGLVRPSNLAAPTDSSVVLAPEREQGTRPLAVSGAELPDGSAVIRGGLSATPETNLAAPSTTEAGGASNTVAAHVGPLAGSGVGPGPASTHRGARNTDPDTSMEAAESVDDHARRSAYDTILRILFEHGPQTDWQLGQRMGLLATSAGKRRGELRDMGLVERTDHRGPTETGAKKGYRWALTDAGTREVAA